MSSSSKGWTEENGKWTAPNEMWEITKAGNAFILTYYPKKDTDVIDIKNPFHSQQDLFDKHESGVRIPKYVYRKFSVILAEWDKAKDTEAQPVVAPDVTPVPKPEPVVEEDHDPRWSALQKLKDDPAFNAVAPELPKAVKTETEIAAEIAVIASTQPLKLKPVNSHPKVPEKGVIHAPSIKANIKRIVPFIADIVADEPGEKTRTKAIVIGAIKTKPTRQNSSVYTAYHIVYEGSGVTETVESGRVYFDYSDIRNKGRINPERTCFVDNVPTIIDMLDEESISPSMYREIKTSMNHRKYLLSKLDVDTLILELEATLQSCRADSETTYDGVLKNQLVPELIKRFRGMLKTTNTN